MKASVLRVSKRSSDSFPFSAATGVRAVASLLPRVGERAAGLRDAVVGVPAPLALRLTSPVGVSRLSGGPAAVGARRPVRTFSFATGPPERAPAFHFMASPSSAHSTAAAATVGGLAAMAAAAGASIGRATATTDGVWATEFDTIAGSTVPASSAATRLWARCIAC
jgi:hypothetical protein